MSTQLRLTRTGRFGTYGLEDLLLARYDAAGRTKLDELVACSGQPWAQYFRPAKASRAGSYEPLPEGLYGLTGPYWAGRPGDYATYFNAGLGPVVIDINPLMATERAELRIHLDANRSTAPGTAGCIGLFWMADLQRLISWWSDPHGAPDRLTVDYSLGTVPAMAPLPSGPSIKYIKIFDHNGKRVAILPDGTALEVVGVKENDHPWAGGSLLIGVRIPG